MKLYPTTFAKSSPQTSPEPTRHHNGLTRLNTEERGANTDLSPLPPWQRHGPSRTQHGVNTDDTRPSRIAQDKHGAIMDLHGANTVAKQTIPDYPGLKNRPGRPRTVPGDTGSFKQFEIAGIVSRTMPDHPGSFRTVPDKLGPNTVQLRMNTEPTLIWPLIGHILFRGYPGQSARSMWLGLKDLILIGKLLVRS